MEEYFEWLCKFVAGESYRHLLLYLDSVPFEAKHDMDNNRIADGIKLRYKFAEDTGKTVEYVENEFDMSSTCSILELIISLAIRIEEDMSDPDYGDRTVIWFWEMIKSLGLYNMMVGEDYEDFLVLNTPTIQTIIEKFINLEYEPSGKGSLFTINNPDVDVRTLDIWYQMGLYVNRLLGL